MVEINILKILKLWKKTHRRYFYEASGKKTHRKYFYEASEKII
jgi:hypothetical protein